MPHSTSAIIAARRIAARAPGHEIPSPRNLGVTFALIMTLSAGCQLEVGGINAQATGPGAGGASSTSGRTTGASSGGGESMSGGEMSGGSTSGGGNPSSSASGPCMATGAEVCNDGKDNDCNGMVDCADPACTSTSFTCTPAIPSNWYSAAFSPTSRPSCPSGYMTFDIVSATAPAYNCNCNCMLTSQPLCTQGMVGIATKGSDPCPASPNISLSANGGACAVTKLTTERDGLVDIAPLPATQGNCNGNVNSTIPPPMQVQGRVCVAPPAGAGCADGGACVASQQAPFTSCIARSGAQTCPPGYPKHFSVGTSVQDTRSCTQCSCAVTATCANPKLTLYTDAICGIGGHDLPVTDKCDPVNDGNGHTYFSYRYSATMTNPICQKTVDTAPTGSLSLVGEGTVCCP